MGEFSEGALVWAWIGKGGPVSGVVTRANLPTPWGTHDRCEVLIGEGLRELDGNQLWATREGAERNPPVVLPSTGRIYPSMIASQMVQVQPMSLPTGLLFYLDSQGSDPGAPEE
jgi:hypothetical protein